MPCSHIQGPQEELSWKSGVPSPALDPREALSSCFSWTPSSSDPLLSSQAGSEKALTRGASDTKCYLLVGPVGKERVRPL